MGGWKKRAKRIERYWKGLCAIPKEDKIGMARYMRSHKTPGERDLWRYLSRENRMWNRVVGRGKARPRWRCQVPKYGFVADFYCPFWKMAVEVDGGSHLNPERMAMDALKDRVFGEHGIRVFRVRWPFEEHPKVFMPRLIQQRQEDFAAAS